MQETLKTLPIHNAVDRPGSSRASSRMPRCGTSEAEVPRIDFIRNRLPHQPKDRADTTRVGVSCKQRREEGGLARSQGRDETEKSERKRRRLVESRSLEEPRERRLGKEGWKREGRQEGRQRIERQVRKGRERRRPKRSSEEGRQEEVSLEGGEERGAPIGELCSLDGSAWSPSPGYPLDDTEGEVVRECYEDERDCGDANSDSKTLGATGDGLCGKAQVNCPNSSTQFAEIFNPTSKPTDEGFGQAEAKGLPGGCSEDFAGFSYETPCGGEVLSASGSAGSLLVKGCGYGESGDYVKNLWTICSKLELKHCKAQPIGRGIFPLPTVHVVSLDPLLATVACGPTVFFNLCRALNSLAGWGCDDVAREVCDVQQQALRYLLRQVSRVSEWPEKFDELSWDMFFKVRSIDYKGDEILTARFVGWKELEPALPKEVGTVFLADVVELGTLHYVTNFEDYLIPEEDMYPTRSPRVMVPPDDWEEVSRGLIERGICGVISEDDVFRVKGQLFLNGLFGVSKSEWVGETEVHRLIYNEPDTC